MKTKNNKDESTEQTEPESPATKRRSRKRPGDNDSLAAEQVDEKPSTSKDTKKPAVKKPIAKRIVKKRPIGISKTLRSKKAPEKKVKAVAQTRSPAKGRKATAKDIKDTIKTEINDEIIEPIEIKKEPIEETSSSRSSSPQVGVTRRQRLTSDVLMMKSVLNDAASVVLSGGRSVRSERSASPYAQMEAKPLRRGQSRKSKSNLLNEAVKNEQKKRRLESESKQGDTASEGDDAKKPKRALSRDGSEISKCSDITESDISLSDTLTNDMDIRLEQKDCNIEKDIKTDINESILNKTFKSDIVPFTRVDRRSRESLPGLGTSETPSKQKCRSSSLDLDNNNRKSRSISTDLQVNTDLDDKVLIVKTENDNVKDKILNKMKRTFSKVRVKNLKKGRAAKNPKLTKTETDVDKIDSDVNKIAENDKSQELISPEMSKIDVSKFYGQTEKIANGDDSNKDDEKIQLRFEDEEQPGDKFEVESAKENVGIRLATVQPIDKLMDKLKHFEELDKKRQQEMRAKTSEVQPVMVTNDVVLITKSGTDIKPLKDVQSTLAPEKPPLKENLLSCFENNSAISILRRDHARKSVDIDIPNTITLIKRNSTSTRKESTGSNNSKEADTISIIEKSFGRDVTLEIRKSIDKTPTEVQQVKPLGSQNHQDNSPAVLAQNIAQNIGLSIDTMQLTITKEPKPIRKSLERKSSEITAEILPEKVDAKVLAESTDKESITSLAANPEPIILKEVSKDNALKVEEAEPEAIVEKSETIESEVEKPLEVEIPNAKMETDATEQVTPGQNKSPRSKAKSKLEKTKKETDEMSEAIDLLAETPESQKEKESILRTLGLLTLKAADEAKIKKQKQKEMYALKSQKAGKLGTESTGTLKTVIKLNRSLDKKKSRSPLKITFQKSKGRSGKSSLEGEGGAETEDTFYTIHKEGSRELQSELTGGHRKTHYSNRYNNNDPLHDPIESTVLPDGKEKPCLVIPEKASSFSIHPERLCQDQCFYCGGKFGLFDTPCHIAQMKSAERQKKVLDNEEKLMIDSCLCDACYRHVVRRSTLGNNYRKQQLYAGSATTTSKGSNSDLHHHNPYAFQDEHDDHTPKDDKCMESDRMDSMNQGVNNTSIVNSKCHAEGCLKHADNSIKRRWLMKMRASVNKVLKLQSDYPGLHTIPLCSEHYKSLSHLMVCALCMKKLSKHHNTHYITQGHEELNPLLVEQHIPVKFYECSVVCKMCRYYCSLLTQPDSQKMNKKMFMKTHTKRLRQIHNVNIKDDSELEMTQQDIQEEIDDQNRRKNKTNKNKTRRSTDSSKNSTEESSESFPDKEKPVTPMEEDIESLISSNKIPVPGATNDDKLAQLEAAVIPALYKQTELQYLLQKQNNPAQFLQMKKPPANKITKPVQKNDKLVKKIQKLGQTISKKDLLKEASEVAQSLSDEITVEAVQGKKPMTDLSTLKNKWEMSGSFSQVKKNLSELSKSIPEQPKKSAVKKLESNSAISVRELLPGEDDINVHCSIEFDNVKGKTPEGWEKCCSTIQYDSKTKNLWNELQKPYGNQSSFLRHLIILEKHFRNGDLVLNQGSQSGTQHYTASVMERIRAFDNVPPPTTNTSSLIDFRKPKPGKSLLKTNQSFTTSTPKQSDKTKQIGSTGKNKINVPGLQVSLPPSVVIEAKPSCSKARPPELIAINSSNSGRKSIENVLKNIQQLVKGVSAPKTPPPPIVIEDDERPRKTPEEVAITKPDHVPMKTSTPEPTRVNAATPKEQAIQKAEIKNKQVLGKGWRPTLMPITSENEERLLKEKPTAAVDGTMKKSLVQVQSGGKKYHISLDDYNKICIKRREKQRCTKEMEHSSPSNHGTSIQQMNQNILANAGLKNLTIAPISSQSQISLPAAIAQLGPSVSVTTELIPDIHKTIPGTSVTVTPTSAPIFSCISMPTSLPKIPKSLTVIPQTVPLNAGMVLPIFPGMGVPSLTQPMQSIVTPNQRP